MHTYIYIHTYTHTHRPKGGVHWIHAAVDCTAVINQFNALEQRLVSQYLYS